MKNLTFLIILVLCTQLSFGQQTREERKAARQEARAERDARKDSLQSLPINTYISFDLINTVIPNPLGRINMGYITPISERWSVGGSAGIGFDALSFYRNDEDYFLWEIRPEIIYNLGKGKRFQHYVGAELFYINNKETLRNDEFEPANTLNGTVTSILYDSATYERKKYGLVFNFGEYINLSDRFAMRTTVGAGFRIKDNSYSDLVNARVDPFDDNDFFIISDTRWEGTRVGFEFNLDLRLIYKLKF